MKQSIAVWMAVVVLAGLVEADDLKIRTLTYKDVTISSFSDEFIQFKVWRTILGEKSPQQKKYKKKITDIQYVKLNSLEPLKDVFSIFNKAEIKRKRGKSAESVELYKKAIKRLGQKQESLKKQWLKLVTNGQKLKAGKIQNASKAKWPKLLIQYRLDQLTGKEDDKVVQTKKVSGKNFCPFCKGRGTVKCETCRGTGRIKCPECNGNWYKVCSRCKGKTKIDGIKYKTRRTRDGRVTRRVYCEEECYECNEIVIIDRKKVGLFWKCELCGNNRYPGYVPCPECKGRKRTTCTECKGIGKATLPTTRPAKKQPLRQPKYRRADTPAG